METTAKEILYDELNDSMVEEIEGTLMEEWILQAMEEYHQSKLKNHGDIADVSKQRKLLIDFSEWIFSERKDVTKKMIRKDVETFLVNE